MDFVHHVRCPNHCRLQIGSIALQPTSFGAENKCLAWPEPEKKASHGRLATPGSKTRPGTFLIVPGRAAECQRSIPTSTLLCAHRQTATCGSSMQSHHPIAKCWSIVESDHHAGQGQSVLKSHACMPKSYVSLVAMVFVSSPCSSKPRMEDSTSYNDLPAAASCCRRQTEPMLRRQALDAETKATSLARQVAALHAQVDRSGQQLSMIWTGNEIN
jgi:hypothetical protein